MGHLIRLPSYAEKEIVPISSVNREKIKIKDPVVGHGHYQVAQYLTTSNRVSVVGRTNKPVQLIQCAGFILLITIARETDRHDRSERLSSFDWSTLYAYRSPYIFGPVIPNCSWRSLRVTTSFLSDSVQ